MSGLNHFGSFKQRKGGTRQEVASLLECRGKHKLAKCRVTSGLGLESEQAYAILTHSKPASGVVIVCVRLVGLYKKDTLTNLIRVFS
jgi:hypothetical protein